MKNLLVTVLTLFSVQVFGQSFEPGLWHFKSNIKVIGISLPETNSDECIPPGKAKDAKGTIAAELEKQGCKITDWVVKKKILNASVRCDNSNFTAEGTLNGEFSRKSYKLEGDAKGKIKKTLPTKAKMSLSGKWIKKKCPAAK